MKINVYLDGDKVGNALSRWAGKYPDRMRSALRATAKDVALEIELLGREDISQAGKFGTRWIQGFHVDVSEGGGYIRINAVEDVPYWTVFEYGATIRGKPLLWIPLSFAQDAQGVWARDFPEPLFRVDRTRQSGRGFTGHKRDPDTGQFTGGYKAPLLLSAKDRQPKYFGTPQVTIPQKFHLHDIARQEAKRMPLLFRAHLKEIKAGG